MYSERGKGNHNWEQNNDIIEAKVKYAEQLELAFKLN